MKIKNLLIAGIVIIGFGFTTLKLSTYKFKFPKRKNVELKIDIPKDWKISKEKRGEDMYYTNFTSNNGEQILLSVLFYKLNDIEKKPIEAIGMNNPIIPYTFFLSNNKTIKMENNVESWDNEDFYFHDSNIEEFSGIKVHQKNIKAYCMYDFDLFAQIHISKLNYTPSDSIQMMEIIKTIKK